MRIRIYRPKNSASWYLDYRHEGHRYRYPVSDKRKVADAAAEDIQRLDATGSFHGPETKATRSDLRTFAELCTEWSRITWPGIAPATRGAYTEILVGLRTAFGETVERKAGEITYSGASTPLREITSRECERVIAAKRAESKTGSPVRANRYLTQLRSMFKKAAKWKLIAEDPTDDMRKATEPRREYDLANSDLDRIMDECEDWLRPVVTAFLLTGCRRGDLLGDTSKRSPKPPLTWADVDLDAGTLLIRKPKEKKTRRVRLTAPLAAVLAALPSRFAKGPVFLDETGSPVQPDRAYRRFKDAAIRAKVPNADKLRLHDLRHAFGTSLAETGARPHDIMVLMGHSSLAMTERYLHSQDGLLRADVARLSGIGKAYNPVSGPVDSTAKQA